MIFQAAESADTESHQDRLDYGLFTLIGKPTNLVYLKWTLDLVKFRALFGQIMSTFGSREPSSRGTFDGWQAVATSMLDLGVEDDT